MFIDKYCYCDTCLKRIGTVDDVNWDNSISFWTNKDNKILDVRHFCEEHLYMIDRFRFVINNGYSSMPINNDDDLKIDMLKAEELHKKAMNTFKSDIDKSVRGIEE